MAVVDDLVFLQGVGATKQTLRRWNESPWQVMQALDRCGARRSRRRCSPPSTRWPAFSTPDPTGIYIPGLRRGPHPEDIGLILFRNSLVLALHAFACVAGFIALNSLPYSAASRSGISRIVHEKAGPYAMIFVAGATLFSLATQAYFIGGILVDRLRPVRALERPPAVPAAAARDDRADRPVPAAGRLARREPAR